MRQCMIYALLMVFISMAKAQVIQPGFPNIDGPKPQAFGFYSRGHLEDADELPEEGFGFVHLFRPRGRYYGTYDLVEILKYTAGQIALAFPGRSRLLIGDLSAKYGGPISGTHVSHQNGLDADFAYYRKRREPKIDRRDTRGFKEDFVFWRWVRRDFDVARTWELFKLFYQTGRVARIFVDRAIKQQLCEHAWALGEYAAHSAFFDLIQDIDSHDDHAHLRITCPKASVSCIDMGPPKDFYRCRLPKPRKRR